MRFTTVLLAAIPFVCAEHTSTRLFHRIYHPTEAQSAFSERGSVVISENNVVSFQPSSSYAQDLIAFAETLRTIPDGADLALYQVALEREGDTVQKQWDVSSVKVVSPASTAGDGWPTLNLLSSATCTESRLKLFTCIHWIHRVSNHTPSTTLFPRSLMKVLARSQDQIK
jgi:hypothetical protein